MNTLSRVVDVRSILFVDAVQSIHRLCPFFMLTR